MVEVALRYVNLWFALLPTPQPTANQLPHTTRAQLEEHTVGFDGEIIRLFDQGVLHVVDGHLLESFDTSVNDPHGSAPGSVVKYTCQCTWRRTARRPTSVLAAEKTSGGMKKKRQEKLSVF